MMRTIEKRFRGMAVSDGAGVKMTRIIGTPELPDLDPFLMLDVFKTENPDDYIAGFPPHPHRGFETVTYMLKGKMRHKDHLGHEGLLVPGGVQWMTAGRGIIHSEMPEQTDGEMKGFQLWINLPGEAKMSEPGYQDYPPEDIPLERHDNGIEIRVVSGKTQTGTVGPIVNPYVNPIYLDVTLPETIEFTQPFTFDETAMVYMIEGQLEWMGQDQSLSAGELAILSEGDGMNVKALEDSRFLVIAGHPLKEPIAKGGPFVMNTQAEVRQAFDDFRNNRF